jgi:hypothetical protein
MTSCYRLGDLIFLGNGYLGLTEDIQNQILLEHPNSLGSEFILEKRSNPSKDNLEIFTNLVLQMIEEKNHLFPQDIENNTVIHLRLGDVVRGNENSEIWKRPLDINDLKKTVPRNNKIFVIGRCHFGCISNETYNDCLTHSKNYLEDVLNTFEADHFDSGNPDIDLCLAVKSKLFVQGRGYYSLLIAEIRRRLNKENIETKCEIHND